jgi:hypothetical protein
LQYKRAAGNDYDDAEQNGDIGERGTETASAHLQHRRGRKHPRLSFDVAAGHLRSPNLRDRASEAGQRRSKKSGNGLTREQAETASRWHR